MPTPSRGEWLDARLLPLRRRRSDTTTRMLRSPSEGSPTELVYIRRNGASCDARGGPVTGRAGDRADPARARPDGATTTVFHWHGRQAPAGKGLDTPDTNVLAWGVPARGVPAWDGSIWDVPARDVPAWDGQVPDARVRADDGGGPGPGRPSRVAGWITARPGGRAGRIPRLPLVAVSIAVVLALTALTAWVLAPSGGHPTDTAAGGPTSAPPTPPPPQSPGSGLSPAPGVQPPVTAPRVQRAATTGEFPTGVAAHTLAQANRWAEFRGRPNDVVVMYTERSSWRAIVEPWIGRDASPFAGFSGIWVISQPLFPDQGPEKGNLADCAAGRYDAEWRQFGRWLVSMGRGDSFVRLGWEFNGLWFAWAATDPQQWVQCFRNASSAIKATSPRVRIDWNLNAHGSTTSVGAFDLYPGDQYVDVIGVDTYDQYPPSPTYADFDNQCNGDGGLCQVILFARTHHKLFSVPEWGVVSQQGTKAGRVGAAGGDNPVYIEKMHEAFVRNADILAYEAYFPDALPNNVRSSLVDPTINPMAAAMYQRLWG
ncbi:glycoside hydrolase family 26 protein [Frankia sp. CcWB3]